MRKGDLDVSKDGLTRLANDLDEMQGHLERQTRRMDEVVDKIAAGWQGPTATAYRSLHRGVAEDAVRIRQVVVVLEAAMRASRGGFTEQELEVLRTKTGSPSTPRRCNTFRETWRRSSASSTRSWTPCTGGPPKSS